MFNSRYIIPLHDLAKYLFVAMWNQSRKLSHIIVLLNVKGFIMLNSSFGIHTKTLRGTEDVGQKSNAFMLLTFSLSFM